MTHHQICNVFYRIFTELRSLPLPHLRVRLLLDLQVRKETNTLIFPLRKRRQIEKMQMIIGGFVWLLLASVDVVIASVDVTMIASDHQKCLVKNSYLQRLLLLSKYRKYVFVAPSPSRFPKQRREAKTFFCQP